MAGSREEEFLQQALKIDKAYLIYLQHEKYTPDFFYNGTFWLWKK
jgi:hypothetical protein